MERQLKQKSQVKSSHIYLYSAFHNTDCIKAANKKTRKQAVSS